MNNLNIDKLNLEKFLNRVAYYNGYDDSDWEKYGYRLVDEHKQAIQQLLSEAYKKGYIDGSINEVTK